MLSSHFQVQSLVISGESNEESDEELNEEVKELNEEPDRTRRKEVNC